VEEGEIIYPFGRARGPSNTFIRYDGVGIGVPVGTPVRTIEGGVVGLAGTFGTYGQGVMIEHGGGFYTLYLYLSRIDVRQGQTVAKGTVVGLSGGARSEEGPHIEFQIREAQGEAVIALDPINWLKNRR
jgi:murein DD-endopeptidase MepM/ murein hydrolase activator NlpD